MLPIIASQALNLVEDLKASSLLRLPWPNDSLLPARLLPTGIPGNARLQLPGFTLMAQVPPSTPMGEIWLQLIQRDMPAKFRILNQSQAIETLSEILQKTEKQSSTKIPSATRNPAPRQSQPVPQPQWHEQGSSRLDIAGFPWLATRVPEGNSVMLRDRNSGQERGMVLGESHHDGFRLQGRLDLEYLGAVLFRLQGNYDAKHWNLTLHTPNNDILSELRAAIHTWTSTQIKQHPNLNSEVLAGLPEDSTSYFAKVQA